MGMLRAQGILWGGRLGPYVLEKPTLGTYPCRPQHLKA